MQDVQPSATGSNVQLRNIATVRLYILATKAGRRSEVKYSREFGLKVTEARILLVMRTFGLLTLERLSREMSLEMGAASRSVTSLVEMGLVRRRRHSLDGRAVELTLAPSGKELSDRLYAAVSEWNEGWLAVLTKHEREIFLSCLDKLIASTAREVDSAPTPAKTRRQELRPARVSSIWDEARAVRSIELEPADGGEWPEVKAGAHIDLHLPNGLVRQYSLINPGKQPRYHIAVLREPESTGGSAYIFDRLRQGDGVRIGGPRINFALRPGTQPVCLIGGGIGVTPLLAMAQTLAGSDRPWRLYYCVREADGVGFGKLLARLGANVEVRVDAEAGGPPSLDEIIAEQPESDYYCCGPRPMLDAFKRATAGLAPGRANIESFDPIVVDGSVEKPFDVELKRSGLHFRVPSDRTLIDVLEEAGVHVLYSCRNGECGTCETGVLDGVPDHRDSVLTEEEKERGDRMMVCCSRAKTDKLVLDL